LVVVRTGNSVVAAFFSILSPVVGNQVILLGVGESLIHFDIRGPIFKKVPKNSEPSTNSRES
jgi:hypothetical protein